jgi:regulator of replication initiation timing
MRVRKREIARAGIYGSADNPQFVSTKDIKEIEETFPDVRRAPVQFGHNATADTPRLGNVVSVYSDNEGTTLYADIEEHETLANAVDSGFYPVVSIGARQRAKDGKMYLHHLAYLGQEPPAIKNLIAEIKEPLGIAASDTNADKLVLFPPLGDFQMNLSEQIKPDKEDHKVTKEEAQKLREENERLKSELDKRDIALSDSIKQKTAADIERLKNALNAAKIPAIQQERFLQIASAIESGKTIELSDSNGGIEKMSGVDALIKVVSAIPPPVQTGVLNLNDPDDQNHNKRDYKSVLNKG